MPAYRQKQAHQSTDAIRRMPRDPIRLCRGGKTTKVQNAWPAPPHASRYEICAGVSEYPPSSIGVNWKTGARAVYAKAMRNV